MPLNFGGIDLIIEDAATVIFDPNVQAVWKMELGSLTIGDVVIFDLSGSDANGMPPTPPDGGKGQGGNDGTQGSPGSNTAELHLGVQNIIVGSLVVRRHGGNGGNGGNASNGGKGNDGFCPNHQGYSGGPGGSGGKGGDGGSVQPVSILYDKIGVKMLTSAHVFVLHGQHISTTPASFAAIGITDDALPGAGGQPGHSGHGGHGGDGAWCFVPPLPNYFTGNGNNRDNEYPPNLGPGARPPMPPPMVFAPR